MFCPNLKQRMIFFYQLLLGKLKRKREMEKGFLFFFKVTHGLCSSRRVKGYMNVGMPLAARCFLISLSVPYQLKPLVEWPIRGR